ncbi:MAG TPA: 50S ribosomal protein L22 [Patescibacteria group bacterium]|jgi:large subunit ribosomal protein L22|nr:50S ribosomal protein L22 [Patescibacteria group bacterium]
MDTLTIKTSAKGISMSPRKVSLVAALVRGRTVSDALVILQHTPKRAAKPLAKAIASAKASAINDFRATESSLVIGDLQVTAGPRLKRFRPIAMGRAHPFQKRTSHIYIALSGTQKPKKNTKGTEQ